MVHVTDAKADDDEMCFTAFILEGVAARERALK